MITWEQLKEDLINMIKLHGFLWTVWMVVKLFFQYVIVYFVLEVIVYHLGKLLEDKND